MITQKDKDTLNRVLDSKTSKNISVQADFLRDVGKMLNEMDESSIESSKMPSVKRTFNGVEVTVGITPEELESLNEQAKEIEQETETSSIFRSVGDNAYIPTFYYVADTGDLCEKAASIIRDLDKSCDFVNLDVFLANNSDISKQLKNFYPVFSKDARGYTLTDNVYNHETGDIISFTQLDKIITPQCDFRYIYEDTETLRDGEAKIPIIGLKEVCEDFLYEVGIDEFEFSRTHQHVFIPDQNVLDNGELFHPINKGKDQFISDYCIADQFDICDNVSSCLEEVMGVTISSVDIPYIFQDEIDASYPIFKRTEDGGYEITGDVYNVETRNITSIAALDKKISSECEFAIDYYDYYGDPAWTEIKVPDIDLRKIFLDSTMDTINDRLAKMDRESEKETEAEEMEM